MNNDKDPYSPSSMEDDPYTAMGPELDKVMQTHDLYSFSKMEDNHYKVMEPKLDKDSILIIHTHDGVPIAESIKENLGKFNDEFQIKVSICDVAEVESRTLNYQVTILLITPEVISYLESITDTPCLSLRFPMNTTCAFLVHESVNFNDEHTESTLKSKMPDFPSWTVLNLRSMRLTIFDTVSLLDQKSPKLFPTILQYRLEPDYITTDKNLVYIMFKEEKEKSSSVVVHVGRRKIEARYLNPYTYSFSPSGLPYGRNSVNVFVGGKSEGTTSLTVGNKMDFLYEEIEDLGSPVEFLCQVLKLSADDRESLDRELGDRINDNVISNFSFLNALDERFSWRDQQIGKELPTMLHFGAKFGLECFCQVLMKVPGFGIAQTIRNKDGHTPSQLARKMGFHNLSYELDPSENRSSNYRFLRESQCSSLGPRLHPKDKQRSASESTSSELWEVRKRTQTEKAQIYRNRKESGLSGNRVSELSTDSGISASADRDVFEGFDYDHMSEEREEDRQHEKLRKRISRELPDKPFPACKDSVLVCATKL